MATKKGSPAERVQAAIAYVDELRQAYEAPRSTGGQVVDVSEAARELGFADFAVSFAPDVWACCEDEDVTHRERHVRAILTGLKKAMKHARGGGCLPFKGADGRQDLRFEAVNGGDEFEPWILVRIASGRE